MGQLLKLFGGNHSSSNLLLDNFTDVNGTALQSHTMDHGAGWTIANGGYQIEGNRAQTSAVFNNPGNVAYANAGQANYTAFLTVNLQSGEDGGLAVRWGGGAFYFCQVQTSNSPAPGYAIYEWSGGAYALLATQAASISTGTDHTIKVVVSGTTITATFDGSTVLSYNSATMNESSTNVGLRIAGTGDPGAGKAAAFKVTP